MFMLVDKYLMKDDNILSAESNKFTLKNSVSVENNK
jgi:hypothetical protein